MSQIIIGAGNEVHRTIGPGLLESAYQECLAREFELRGVAFERERVLPIHYKGVILDCGYRLDFLIDQQVVVEVKAVDALLAIHEAQLMTYLRLGAWKLGLLLNFNVPVLSKGIKRIVMGLED